MATERLSVSDLKERLTTISEGAIELPGIAKINLTKDINSDWTLIGIDRDGVMREIYGPTGIREMISWLDGVIWALNHK